MERSFFIYSKLRREALNAKSAKHTQRIVKQTGFLFAFFAHFAVKVVRYHSIKKTLLAKPGGFLYGLNV
jgi:hypothetical protein